MRRSLTLLAAAAALAAASSPAAARTVGGCSGQTLWPGQNAAAAVNSGAPGSAYCFQPGTYRLWQTIRPKNGMRLQGLPGARLDAHGLKDAIASSAANVTVSGLIVQGGADRGIRALGRGWVITGNEVAWNGQVGITGKDGAQITRNYIHHNGRLGINGEGAGILVAGNEVAWNDTHNHGASCYNDGGAKWVYTTGLVVSGNYFHDNRCNGIWLDIDNVDSRVVGNRSVGNRGDGITHEISYRATISGNQVSGNAGFGIMIRSSAGDTVSSNSIGPNREGGIILMMNKPRTDHSFWAGPHVVRDTDVYGNTIVQWSAGDKIGGIDNTGGQLYRSNRFHGNHYRLRSLSDTIFRWNGQHLNANGWRQAGQDRDGTFTVGGGGGFAAAGAQPPLRFSRSIWARMMRSIGNAPVRG